VALLRLSSAELYSDVDSTERDEAKALEIKAKDFWQGLMDSADGLATGDNAQLCAEVEEALEKLPKEDNIIREHFQAAIEHLAKADALMFEEAASFKMLASEKLGKASNADAKASNVYSDTNKAIWHNDGDWQDSFVSAVTRFIGTDKRYEKKLAGHIVSRLRESTPYLNRAHELAPLMLEESGKAGDLAHKVQRLGLTRAAGGGKPLPGTLQRLAGRITTATGKQRLRFTNYLLKSWMTTAESIAGKNEKASKTVMKASLRGVDQNVRSQEPAVQSEPAVPREPAEQSEPEPAVQIKAEPAVQIMLEAAVQIAPEPVVTLHPSRRRKEEALAQLTRSAREEVAQKAVPAIPAEPPLIFVDGIPVDAKPISDYTSNVEQVMDV